MTASVKVFSLAEAAKIVKRGGVVAYPTETVYGLGADPRNRTALRKIFKVKGREKGKPILILISSRAVLKKWVLGCGRRERILMNAFWPGPLTLVFRAKKGVPLELTAGKGKIGIRFSSLKTATALCRKVGGAITSTSANRSGEPALTKAGSVQKILGQKLDGIIEERCGKLKSKGSTILDISGIKMKVLREGDIPFKKIKSILQKKGFPHAAL